MFGDKCSYIHPNVPCKYGFYCTRIGCSYSHPAGWNPGMGMYPNVMHPIPYKGKKKYPTTNEEAKETTTENVQEQVKGNDETNVQVEQTNEQQQQNVEETQDAQPQTQQ